MSSTTHYTAPALTTYEALDGGRLDVIPPPGELTLTLGSDLVLTTVHRDDDGRPPYVFIRVCDADANHLTTIAVVPWSMLDVALPLAVASAIRLFPSHLYREA